MPSEHRIAGGTRPRAAEKAGLPIGRRASMLAHQPGEPHDRALPASRGRFRKALDQIAKNCRARRTVKEHYFLHGKGSAKDDLIDDVRHGRPTRLDTQLDIEVQIRPLVGETGQRMNQGVRPTERPLPQEPMVQPVRRDNVLHGPEGVHLSCQFLGESNRRPYPEPFVGQPGPCLDEGPTSAPRAACEGVTDWRQSS